ncbi:thioredoxin family protein [Sandaracinomonas limnophila]|uniref:Thioredoxin family protein n=1 Tax=Sandaracinomonas limnophila TaxID=1862386 RepID=A0A437PMD3_9BACT|nr:thioredoxin family protein [Sandaracinomonas limnophila]RVU23443.1 thioredoxin family protein [Sandaracinomonas limnophila]
MKKFLSLSLIFISLTVIAQDEPKGVNFFEGSFKQALAKAKKENKLVMLDAYTTWCGPCKVLKTKVFPNKELGDYMNQHFVSIGVDMEAGEGIQLGNTYPIDGYPTLIFFDSDGKIKKKILGLPRGGAQELLSVVKAIK